MKDYKTLIQKFWSRSASESEKLQLYKTIIQEEEIIKDELYKEFDMKSEVAPLQQNESQDILTALHNELKDETLPKHRIGITNIIKWSASIAAIFILAIMLFKQFSNRQALIDSNKQIVSNEKIINNNTKEIKIITLPDSSIVTIYPSSDIRYQNNLNALAVRTIFLNGKANFKVQHNSDKPFEVIARQIKTTDIGTEFCIDASLPNKIKIKLKEGSIKVEALPDSKINMKSTVMKPGEELKIDFGAKQVEVINSTKEKLITHNENKPSLQQHSKEKLAFNSAPLAEVFDKLMKRDQVKIIFNTPDVDGLTFTGNIEPNDSLNTTLDILCNLNGLLYTKTQKGIIISKSK